MFCVAASKAVLPAAPSLSDSMTFTGQAAQHRAAYQKQAGFLERWKKGTNPKYFMGRKRRVIDRVTDIWHLVLIDLYHEIINLSKL